MGQNENTQTNLLSERKRKLGLSPRELGVSSVCLCLPVPPFLGIEMRTRAVVPVWT